MNDPIISVSGLSKRFGDFVAVDRITFEVGRGEIFGFLGANGAGKTTLIKKLIAQVSGVAVPIGPYEPRTAAKHASNAEQSLHALEKLGLDVSIEDSAKKKR